MSLKVRSLWPECKDPRTHEDCAGTDGNRECICWHHIAQARSIRNATLLLEEIEQELRSIAEKEYL